MRFRRGGKGGELSRMCGVQHCAPYYQNEPQGDAASMQTSLERKKKAEFAAAYKSTRVHVGRQAQASSPPKGFANARISFDDHGWGCATRPRTRLAQRAILETKLPRSLSPPSLEGDARATTTQSSESCFPPPLRHSLSWTLPHLSNVH